MSASERPDHLYDPVIKVDCLGVRQTTDQTNPASGRWLARKLRRILAGRCSAMSNAEFCHAHARARIEHALREFEGRFLIVPVPNLTHVFYGRDVGYSIEKIELGSDVQAISGTESRRRLRLPAECVDND